MKIANADKLKQHFENVVDVKLFTPAQICTIIDTFSTEVKEGDVIAYSQDKKGNILCHNITEELKQQNLLRERAQWINPTTSAVIVNKEYFSNCSRCGHIVDEETRYCSSCGAMMLKSIGGAEP